VRRNITADPHFLKSVGFDGIRIWPNLNNGPQLMNGDGSLRPDELKHFLSILNTAKAERLVIDVTFTYEHIADMTPSTALAGIANTTVAVHSYDNLLFDIQNESNVQDRRFMSEDDVGRIFHTRSRGSALTLRRGGGATGKTCAVVRGSRLKTMAAYSGRRCRFVRYNLTHLPAFVLETQCARRCADPDCV
jgi:hypothetical protein